MLEFGMFQRNGKEDLKVIFSSIYEILDYAHPPENTREARLHNDIRLAALQLLERMMDIRVNSRISTVVEAWEDICDRAFPSTRTQGRLDLRTCAASLEEKLFSHNIVSPADISADNYQIDKWRGADGDRSVHLLLKLCHMQHAGIRNRALLLLMRHLTQKSSLFSALREVELLAFPSAVAALAEMQIGMQKLTGVRKYLSGALGISGAHLVFLCLALSTSQVRLPLRQHTLPLPLLVS